jgi:hypothetical protein
MMSIRVGKPPLAWRFKTTGGAVQGFFELIRVEPSGM